ncbi:hypothetical protein N5W20_05315 [Candidatus Kirkpatrickella diaphorinae]|uniref:DUF4145 domain-containing protein n=1 Tax=Candidatus Kirkpatrickella diaphorinae TaxID=2984322 RepID=A0ABY6GGY5_9PROT|nr:hypothetical protein [Candidatus Kirkpatrickella diaphorinae]UYH50547.1 hypothetical protein N5W20_05315 [Candidatus Kirkpatrickella diaphorinae]
MIADGKTLEINIEKIFLDLRNPRHEPLDTESAAIEYLCKNESVLPLAQDIVLNGLNQLEMMAVIPCEGSGTDASSTSYWAAEGNRRLCALKLLADPERAPAKWRKRFERLGERWERIVSLPCVIFPDRDSVAPWLARIHEGELDGKGRKKWNADQIARHSGENKNKIALFILDYAEREGLLSTEKRKGKLTTVSRYLNDKSVREALGVDASDMDDICSVLAKQDFDSLLQKFLDDLETGEVSSRKNKAAREIYARELRASRSHTVDSPGLLPLRGDKSKVPPTESTTEKKSSKQDRITHIKHHPEIKEALERIGGQKLPSIYNSITSIKLEPHTPLLTLGVWTLIESLSALMGRKSNTDFPSYFGKDVLQRLGLSEGKGDKAIKNVLQQISHLGDITKHHSIAASLDGKQLANHMEVLKDFFLKCAEEAYLKSNETEVTDRLMPC